MRFIILSIIISLAGFYFTFDQQVKLPVGSECDYNKTCFWLPWGDHRHNGIDIFAKKGTDIKPVTAGIVINIQHNTKIGGNTVSILGTKGRVYYYAHLDTTNVSLGQIITTKSIIGTVGNSGNAQTTPAHLHFSIFSLWPQGCECHKDSKYHFYCLNPIKEMDLSKNKH